MENDKTENYNVLLIKKYSEEINGEKKRIIFESICAGLGLLVSAGCTFLAPTSLSSEAEIMRLISIISYSMISGYAVGSLRTSEKKVKALEERVISLNDNITNTEEHSLKLERK
ncbi:MAG: hypothetical protein RR228_02825 [Bacilli bacterium]